MRHLRTLAPWIAYPAAPRFFGWGRPARAPCGGAAIVIFGALTVVAIADPAAALHHFVPALIPAALAVAAIVSIACGHPFTETFAKRVAPREYWDTPLFAHINLVLTAVWAASFAVTAVVVASALALTPHATVIILATQVAAFVVPMRITRSYPARARARY